MIRKGNDPVLRQIAKPVGEVTKAIGKLLDDMSQTMYDAPGIGLAAPQIGVSKRIVVIDVGKGLIELINPEIVRKSGLNRATEGCLSLPGLVGDVTRATEVSVRGLNREGEMFEFEASELLARCVQHEIDHLNGVLFTDYLKPSEIRHESESKEG